MGAAPVALGGRSAAVRRCIVHIAVCLWAVAGYGELPPISAFTDPSDYGTVAVSPTGEYLALTMRHEDGATFRVVTYPDNEIKVNATSAASVASARSPTCSGLLTSMLWFSRPTAEAPSKVSVVPAS